jgi:hypothetical protein
MGIEAGFFASLVIAKIVYLTTSDRIGGKLVVFSSIRRPLPPTTPTQPLWALPARESAKIGTHYLPA